MSWGKRRRRSEDCWLPWCWPERAWVAAAAENTARDRGPCKQLNWASDSRGKKAGKPSSTRWEREQSLRWAVGSHPAWAPRGPRQKSPQSFPLGLEEGSIHPPASLPLWRRVTSWGVHSCVLPGVCKPQGSGTGGAWVERRAALRVHVQQ